MRRLRAIEGPVVQEFLAGDLEHLDSPRDGPHLLADVHGDSFARRDSGSDARQRMLVADDVVTMA